MTTVLIIAAVVFVAYAVVLLRQVLARTPVEVAAADEALAQTGEFDVLDEHFASAQAALAALLPPRPLTPMEQWELRLIERQLLDDPDLRALFEGRQT